MAPIEARACDWPGCAESGIYPAPRSRRELRRHYWFCLEHVRAYNSSWNYYSGMTEAEVEADIRFDTVWQRPTWRLHPATGVKGVHAAHVSDGFGFFVGDDDRPRHQPVTAEERALLVLELRPPVTVAIVKARYKDLVKRHHPDANGGDKDCEERFKAINEAYRTVLSKLTQ